MTISEIGSSLFSDNKPLLQKKVVGNQPQKNGGWTSRVI